MLLFTYTSQYSWFQESRIDPAAMMEAWYAWSGNFLQSFSPQGSFTRFFQPESPAHEFSALIELENSPTFAASQVIVLKAWATSALCHVSPQV